LPTIDPNAGLAPGQQYTLSMAEAGIVGTVIGTNVDKVNADLSAGEDSGAIDIAAGAVASQSMLYAFSQPPYDITFTYTGDGSDSPMDVFQQFANVLNGFGFSWNFVICVGGTAAGTAAAQTQAQIGSAVSAVENAASLAASPSFLWPVVILVLVAVFVFSGGASILRHATA
jgi:hypothetical protein